VGLRLHVQNQKLHLQDRSASGQQDQLPDDSIENDVHPPFRHYLDHAPSRRAGHDFALFDDYAKVMEFCGGGEHVAARQRGVAVFSARTTYHATCEQAA